MNTTALSVTVLVTVPFQKFRFLSRLGRSVPEYGRTREATKPIDRLVLPVLWCGILWGGAFT